ncbi:MAG: hypothetical protein ACI9GY_001109 [Brevundimonas sp.]
MNTHAENEQENKSESFANEPTQSEGTTEATFQFVDNRPESIQMQQLQELANDSPQISGIAQLQAMADNFTIQEPPIQRQENKTGLPDNLKWGMENLTGHSLNDVKVHRNSDKPAQLQAHAYAQGSDIHLGPGQEKHLPHELGHVVQQKQGRVKATKQMKGKVAVNDDAGLESEATAMGVKALQMSSESIGKDSSYLQMKTKSNVVQKAAGDDRGSQEEEEEEEEEESRAKNQTTLGKVTSKVKSAVSSGIDTIDSVSGDADDLGITEVADANMQAISDSAILGGISIAAKAKSMVSAWHTAIKKPNTMNKTEAMLTTGEVAAGAADLVQKYSTKFMAGGDGEARGEMIPGLSAALAMAGNGKTLWVKHQSRVKLETLKEKGEDGLILSDEDKKVIDAYRRRMSAQMLDQTIELIINTADLVTSPIPGNPLALISPAIKATKAAIFIAKGLGVAYYNYKAGKAVQADDRISGDQDIDRKELKNIDKLLSQSDKDGSIRAMVTVQYKIEEMIKEDHEANNSLIIRLSTKRERMMAEYNKSLTSVKAEKVTLKNISSITNIHKNTIAKIINQVKNEKLRWQRFKSGFCIESKIMAVEDLGQAYNKKGENFTPDNIDLTEIENSDGGDYFWHKMKSQVKIASKRKDWVKTTQELEDNVKKVLLKNKDKLSAQWEKSAPNKWEKYKNNSEVYTYEMLVDDFINNISR